jgi:hypothetical protein
MGVPEVEAKIEAVTATITLPVGIVKSLKKLVGKCSEHQLKNNLGFTDSEVLSVSQYYSVISNAE